MADDPHGSDPHASDPHGGGGWGGGYEEDMDTRAPRVAAAREEMEVGTRVCASWGEWASNFMERAAAAHGYTTANLDIPPTYYAGKDIGIEQVVPDPETAKSFKNKVEAADAAFERHKRAKKNACGPPWPGAGK